MEIPVRDLLGSQVTWPGSCDQQSLSTTARASRPEDSAGGRPSGPGVLCLSCTGLRRRYALSGALQANVSSFSPMPFLPTSRFSSVFTHIFVRASLTRPAPAEPPSASPRRVGKAGFRTYTRGQPADCDPSQGRGCLGRPEAGTGSGLDWPTML